MIRGIATALISITLLVGGFLLFKNVFNQTRVIEIESPNEEKLEEEINILILGRVGEGQGGKWHSAPDLVDTIFVVNLDTDKGVANLISLPRDLYGDIGGENIRINRILYDSKIDDFLELLLEITGLETERYVIVDLDIVSAIVDGLGGIEVELAGNVIDPVSGFTLSKGVKTLSGEDAVWLIRNRFAPEGDFFRERNQHLVIESAFDKFNKLGSIEKTTFVFKMLPHVSKSETNFGVGTLLSQLRDLGGVSFNSVVLDFETKLLDASIIPIGEDEAYVLIPKEGINEYDKVREFIQKSLR